MPLPLAVPLLIAAASTTTSTTTVALGGVAVGGASVGGFWWWSRRSSASKPSAEHLAALEQQNQLTKLGIDKTRQALEELCLKTTSLIGQMIDATASSSATTDRIQVLRGELIATRNSLTSAFTLANESSDVLRVFGSVLEQFVDQVFQKGETSLDEMRQLKTLLDSKTSELKDAVANIDGLSITVERQATNLADLTKALQALKIENISQKDTIERYAQMHQRFFNVMKVHESFVPSLVNATKI